MELNLVSANLSNPRSAYVILIETMTGDGDDEHEVSITTDSVEELREIIIGLQILDKSENPEGYCGDFFNQYIEGQLYEEYGVYDALCISRAVIRYFDENGNEFYVNYTLDEDMIQKINSLHGLSKEDIKSMGLKLS